MNVAMWHTLYVFFKEPDGAPNPDAPERRIVPPHRAHIKPKGRSDLCGGEDAPKGQLL